MIKCKMKIERIMFPKDREVNSGDFCIFTAKVVQHLAGGYPVVHSFFETVSLKGEVPQIEVGDVFTITFDTPETNNYGTSYTVLSVTKEIDPENKEELRDYLRLMCGESLALELMKLENPYQLLQEKNNEELLKVKGIKKSRLEQIYKKIETYSDNSLAFVKLEPLGLTKTQIKNICLAVGGAINAIDICHNNPYSLIKKVKGIGFKIADDIAIKCGMNPFSPVRIKSAVIHLLQEAGEAGKSYLYATQLLQEIKKIVSIEFYTLIVLLASLILTISFAISCSSFIL